MYGLISTNCCRRGLTLIEVVAGLALMGTLVAAMLSGKSRFTGQYHHAQRVLAAVDAMDAFLIDRWPTVETIEDGESGDLEGQKNLGWRVSVVDDPVAADWHCRVVRVQVLDSLGEPGALPLVSVDLLVSDPPPSAEQDVPGSQDFDEVLNESSLFEEDRSGINESDRSIQEENESSVPGQARPGPPPLEAAPAEPPSRDEAQRGLGAFNRPIQSGDELPDFGENP